MTRSGYSRAARTTHAAAPGSAAQDDAATFSTKLPACAEICFAPFPQTTKNLNKSRGERGIHHNPRPAETLVNIGGLSGGGWGGVETCNLPFRPEKNGSCSCLLSLTRVLCWGAETTFHWTNEAVE